MLNPYVSGAYYCGLVTIFLGLHLCEFFLVSFDLGYFAMMSSSEACRSMVLLLTITVEFCSGK